MSIKLKIGRNFFIVGSNILLYFFIYSCSNGPIGKSIDQKTMKLTFFNLMTSSNSAQVVWGCSAEADGYLGFGKKSLDSFNVSPFPSKIHLMTMSNLNGDTDYVYQAFCGAVGFEATTFLQTFRTRGVSDELANRGLWILGGLGSSGAAVSQVDLFDPLENKWYANVTAVPSPRLFAGIVSHKGKIYVMGGLIYTAPSTFTPSNIVEVYDPSLNTWSTAAPMPVNLQGFLAASVGEAIFAFGGTTTAFMQSGTVLNTVYKFTPSPTGSGSWVTKLSLTALQGKVDMGGCAIDGTIFFNTGRFHSDGSAQNTHDAYVPSANTTTTLSEAVFTTARHGSASACYRPLSTDLFPNDALAVLVVGGNTALDLAQPAQAITATDVFEYYIAGPSLPLTNVVQSGPILPVKRYYAAMEISYKTRKAYVFGGMLNQNVPTDTVYAIDLANPLAGPWFNLASTMPMARYAHKAVIINH